MRLLTDREYQDIWDKIDKYFSFNPSMQANPFSFWQTNKVFSLESYWNENQEAIINTIFCSLSNSEIYALDWQHDCFLFSPHEKVPTCLSWYDELRNCNVYFPEYYPNGDYHFFIAQDFSYGMMGHPWRKELWVFGQKLIEELQREQKSLYLLEKSMK